jgi:VanZ family protein
MAVIFLFSTDLFAGRQTASWFDTLLPFLSPEAQEGLHLAIRKAGHFIEYFILAVLLQRAWHCQLPAQPALRRTCLVVLLSAFYAVSDEWHQSFVPSRSASAMDVLIDSCGALCGAIGFNRWSTIRRPHL